MIKPTDILPTWVWWVVKGLLWIPLFLAAAVCGTCTRAIDWIDSV